MQRLTYLGQLRTAMHNPQSLFSTLGLILFQHLVPVLMCFRLMAQLSLLAVLLPALVVCNMLWQEAISLTLKHTRLQKV